MSAENQTIRSKSRLLLYNMTLIFLNPILLNSPLILLNASTRFHHINRKNPLKTYRNKDVLCLNKEKISKKRSLKFYI